MKNISIALLVTLSVSACKSREYNASAQDVNQNMTGSKFAVKIYQGAYSIADNKWVGTIEAENVKGTCSIVESKMASLVNPSLKDRFVSCKYAVGGKTKNFLALVPHQKASVRAAVGEGSGDAGSVTTTYCDYNSAAPQGLLMACTSNAWEPARISIKFTGAGREYTGHLSAAPNFTAKLTCKPVTFESATIVETLECTGTDTTSGRNVVYSLRMRAEMAGQSTSKTATSGYVTYKSGSTEAERYTSTFTCAKPQEASDPNEIVSCYM